MDIAERFWQRVAVAGPDECWLWLGKPDVHGYGQFHVGDKTPGSHRVAYELVNGPLNGQACHTCDVKLCCNPNHIYDGTPITNGEDRQGIQQRKKHNRLSLKERQEIHKRLNTGESAYSLAKEFDTVPQTLLRYRKTPFNKLDNFPFGNFGVR